MNESHPLKPFFPENCRLLMCGTFPPAANRWSMQFYYPNYINDMWRIFGLVFLGDKDALVDVGEKTFRLDNIKELLVRKGIGLSDTGKEVERTKGNASDKYLDIKKSIDLPVVFSRLPDCVALATTGEKAASVIANLTATGLPPMGGKVECEIKDSFGEVRRFHHYRMPSSSRAYPMRLEDKARFYRRMFVDLGMIDE